jgi:hypothetical protein
MLQTDGPHDVACWREMADMSVEHSDIVGDEDRTYDSETLVAQRLSPSYQLQYLMGRRPGGMPRSSRTRLCGAGLAAIGAQLPDVDGWDYDWDCVELVIAAAASDDTELSRVGADLLTRYHRHIFDSLPANWPEVFAALRPS